VPAPTLEATAAVILAQFGRMWRRFVAARGAFDDWMDLYLDRWLHSCVRSVTCACVAPLTRACRDQLVTLTTVTPPRAVRIVGITPDHGLLRTLPERVPGALGASAQFVDLQPDGNSFDLMAGLISTKR
jgi:biotin--protein ligase